jgi:hypothetical protein
MLALLIDNEYFIDVAIEYQVPLNITDAILMLQFLEIDGHKNWRLPYVIERNYLFREKQVKASSSFELWWAYDIANFNTIEGLDQYSSDNRRMVIPVRTIGKQHE